MKSSGASLSQPAHSDEPETEIDVRSQSQTTYPIQKISSKRMSQYKIYQVNPVKVLQGSGLPCVGNAVDQKICQRLPCPMTGLSGILGGTDGTVRLQKRTKRKRTVRK